MTDTLQSLLHTGAAATLFQPIYDVRCGPFHVWAVEALTRGPAGEEYAIVVLRVKEIMKSAL